MEGCLQFCGMLLKFVFFYATPHPHPLFIHSPSPLLSHSLLSSLLSLFAPLSSFPSLIPSPSPLPSFLHSLPSPPLFPTLSSFPSSLLFSPFLLQALYAIARSAGALMYESNVRCQFLVPGGQLVTEKLFGFPIIPDDTVVTQDVVAVGFDCGAPPEPSVNTGQEGVIPARPDSTYSASLSPSLPVCLPVSQPACLSAYLSVCLSVSFSPCATVQA